MTRWFSDDPPTRGEVAGYPLDDPKQPPDKLISYYVEGFRGVAAYDARTTEYMRTRDVYLAMELVALRQLEIPGAPDAGPWVEAGLDAALHLFLDDWSNPPDPHDDRPARPYNLAIASKRRHKDVGWSTAFSRGLILALLSRRPADVARLAAWPWADIRVDYSGMGDDVEEEHALMFVLVAAGLRPKPMRNIDALLARIRRSRLKRPRLLIKLWEAWQAGDQPAFDDALVRSVRHHADSPRPDPADARIASRLALATSAVALAAASSRGLTIPELPNDLVPFLLTRTSIGLAP